MKYHSVDDVFGVNRNLPLNYVERKSADTLLIENLSRKQHIVIYGSSKQGKTSLRKHCLMDDDYITIQCSNRYSLENLHSSILKQVGFEITQSTTISSSGKAKISAQLKAGFSIMSGKTSASYQEDQTKSEKKAPLELDIDDVNDIIHALNYTNFTKYIVLEDFHYLPIETQKDFAVALKSFHENSSICFIIIGVWLEENRLSVYNGDLTGRLLPINADKWEPDELEQVIEAGEALLNVTFSDQFKTTLLNISYNSVYIVQEACLQCCKNENIYRTQENNITLGNDIDCHSLVNNVVGQQSGRFHSFLTQFAEGFQNTQLEMHKWLLYPVIKATPEQLSKGFKLAEIRKALEQKHPRQKDLNSGNVTQSLQSTTSLQIKKDIKPMVLDYDQTNLRLNIVDKSFAIWLSRQKKAELLGLLGLPTN